MEDPKYTIQELSELTGFSLRTIRYYVQEGLIEIGRASCRERV